MTNQLNPATVTVYGKTYDAKAHIGCDGCDAELVCDELHELAKCGRYARPDGKTVIWIERKEDTESWREDYAERQAKGEVFQIQGLNGWFDGVWDFALTKELYRPKPAESPAEPDDDDDDVPIEGKSSTGPKGV